MFDWSYKEAVEHIQSLELLGMRLGLDRMRMLTDALGNPQKSFASIHVVGTNGKTSTARMIASLLERHDLRSGAYYSPHLFDFRDRIEIGERVVTEEGFARAVASAASAAIEVESRLSEGERITQFELLTAAAFAELAERGVQVAVVEAGLGGRYDATNVLDSDVQVLTNVALEHTRWLGSSLVEICGEKLAVLPVGGQLITGALVPEAARMIEKTAQKLGATVVAQDRDVRWWSQGGDLVVEAKQTYDGLKLGVPGIFQRDNFTLATAAAETLLDGLDAAAVRRAAAEVEIPGRLEIVDTEPLTLLDGAHNPAAMRALVASLPPIVGERSLVTVISVLDDKDFAAMVAELLPRCAHLVCTRSSHRRAVPAHELAQQCRRYDVGSIARDSAPGRRLKIWSEPDPFAALALGRKLTGSRGALLVTGSLYLLSDLVCGGRAVAPAAAARPKRTLAAA